MFGSPCVSSSSQTSVRRLESTIRKQIRVVETQQRMTEREERIWKTQACPEILALFILPLQLYQMVSLKDYPDKSWSITVQSIPCLPLWMMKRENKREPGKEQEMKRFFLPSTQTGSNPVSVVSL